MKNNYIQTSGVSLFEQMANIIEEVMWISDVEKQKVIYISPAYEKIWGHSCQSLYDNPISFVNAIHPEDREGILLSFAKQKIGTYNEVYRIINPNGEVRWVHDRAYPPTRLTDGTICVMGIAKDITIQKQSELTLIKIEGRFRSIIDFSPVPLAMNNESMEVTFLNPAFIATFGYSIEDIPTLMDWWPKAYPDPIYRESVANSWQKELENAKRTATAFTPQELNICCKDGTMKVVLASAAPLSDQYKGDHLVILYDITNLKNAEKEKENLRLQVMQSSKLASLGELAAGIAHEINNPLTIVKGAANQLIKFKDNPDKLESKIDAIQKAILRISKIVTSLKKYSRSSESLSFKSCVLSEIVKEAISLIAIKADRGNVEIKFVVSSNANIKADEISIEQVVINLVNNAIDAVNGSDEKWVQVSVSEEDSFVILRVMDSGSGIPEEVQNRIFEPFFTTKPIGEGTGLGLSVCKGILKEHNATIAILPNSSKTCFEVKFQKADEII